MIRRGIKVCMAAYALAFTILVVACRKHYSVDVAAGFVVAWVVQDNFDNAVGTGRRWLRSIVALGAKATRHAPSSPGGGKLDFGESQTRELWT